MPSWFSQNCFWLLVPLCILVLAFAIFSWFSFGKAPTKQAEKSGEEKSNTEYATKIDPPLGYPIRVIVDSIPPPKGPTEQEIADKKEEKRERKFKNKLEVGATFVALGLLSINVLLWCTADKAANAAKDSLQWLQYQTRQSFPRPIIAARLPDTWVIRPGKPIKPDIQIFNYGNVAGIARARIRFEKGPGIIEKFRSNMLKSAYEFDVPETMETREAIIRPNEGNSFFPIESPEVVLSAEDVAKLKTGTTEVVIYGRIRYADLALKADGARFDLRDKRSPSAYSAIFCFYVMRDGTTVSACPNQRYPEKEAYTNFSP